MKASGPEFDFPRAKTKLSMEIMAETPMLLDEMTGNTRCTQKQTARPHLEKVEGEA